MMNEENEDRPGEDIIRVIRIIEYVGPRRRIEKQIAHSIHGTRHIGNDCAFTAVTLGEYPEIMRRAGEAGADETSEVDNATDNV